MAIEMLIGVIRLIRQSASLHFNAKHRSNCQVAAQPDLQNIAVPPAFALITRGKCRSGYSIEEAVNAKVAKNTEKDECGFLHLALFT